MAAHRLYNWEKWFRQRTTTLVRGVDYHCSQSSMVAIIRNNASRRRVRVRLKDSGNTITIEVLGDIPNPHPPAVPDKQPYALETSCSA